MKKWITIVLSVCVGTAALATEEVSYLAGELPPPAKIEKVLSAGNPPDVLLLSSAPNKLLGLAGFNMEKRGKLFPAPLQSLPTLGKIAGKGSTLSPEKIVALQPNLIIDVGNVTPNYIDQAKRTFENVVEGDHKGLTQVSMEQLLLWNPDVIFSQYPEFLQTLKDNPQWQQLSAVKNGHVFLIPNNPFGWLDSPPSVNRLLGVRWVSHLVTGKPIAEFAKEVQTFYHLFYQIELTAEQVAQLLHDVK